MRTKPSRLAHVVYRTHRFAEMLDWYTRAFDTSIQYQNPALAFLTYDDEHHRFAIANLDVIRPDTGNKDARGLVGVDHIAFAYDSLADLLETYAELKAKQIVPYWAVHHGMSVSLYYADPDGNQLEFTVDAFPDAKACHDFFRSGVMDRTGVGTRYDPDDWLARIRAGADAWALMKDLPPGAPSDIPGTVMTAEA